MTNKKNSDKKKENFRKYKCYEKWLRQKQFPCVDQNTYRYDTIGYALRGKQVNCSGLKQFSMCISKYI
jgi:hypothetical protein